MFVQLTGGAGSLQERVGVPGPSFANTVVGISHVVCFGGAAGSPAGTPVQPDASVRAGATWYVTPKKSDPACSVGLSCPTSTPRFEKKFVKSTTGPAMPAAAPPTQSIDATFLPARSAAFAIVSACIVPGAEKEVRFENASPPRKYVLFVEPCSDGYVPVAIVYQPTPVFGGKAGVIPLSPVTPCFISSV